MIASCYYGGEVLVKKEQKLTTNTPSLPSDQWYVLARTTEVTKFPIRKILFNKPYVLFKSHNEKICVLRDFCPHRGYPLSEGSVVEEGIKCKYHGWCFNSEGRCQKIPGLNSITNVSVQTVNYQQCNEFIWISEGEKAFTIFKPSLEERMIKLDYTINCSPYLLIENTLDPMHTPYIHSSLVRSDVKNRKDVEIIINNDDSMVEAIFKNEGKQSGLISKLFSVKDICGIGRYIHPGVLQLEFKTTKKIYVQFTAFLSPLSNNKTAIYLNIGYSALKFRIDVLMKPLFALLIKRVIKQDIFACEKQQKNLIANPKEKFKSTKLDYMYPYINSFLNNAPKESRSTAVNLLL